MSKKIKKRVFKGAVIGLSALLLTFVSLETFGSGKVKPSEWFNHSIEENIATPVGAVIKNVKSNGITLFSNPVTYSDDVSTLSAESTYTITATVYPSEATNKSVTGLLSWTNASSSWATGKTVTDYATITQTSTGVFTLSVLQAFGEQITLTVTSEDNADATASCTIDYVKRVQSVSLKLSGSDVTSATGNLKLISCSSNITVAYSVRYGTGTITGSFTGGSITTTLSSGLFNTCKTATTSGSWNFNQSSTAFIYANLSSAESTSVTVGACTKFISSIGSPGTGKSQWTTAFYNYVNNNASAAHATLSMPYSYGYNGVASSSGTATCGVLFRASSVEVTTASVTLDQSSIYV